MFPIEREHLEGIFRILSDYSLEDHTINYKNDEMQICSVYTEYEEWQISVDATYDIKNYMSTLNYDIDYTPKLNELDNHKECFEFKIIIIYKG
jgi:hypothetical protein